MAVFKREQYHHMHVSPIIGEVAVLFRVSEVLGSWSLSPPSKQMGTYGLVSQNIHNHLPDYMLSCQEGCGPYCQTSDCYEHCKSNVLFLMNTFHIMNEKYCLPFAFSSYNIGLWPNL
jgi:hypothetical protein